MTRAPLTSGIVVVLLSLAIAGGSAGAGCCQYSVGCFPSNDPTGCVNDAGGTFFPDPSTCNEAADPPSCTNGTTTTTTIPGPGLPDDGRLNPDPSEYYAIWCANDLIFVWRSVPTAAVVKEVPIAVALQLSVGESVGLGDFMELERSDEATATIYGSNGNLAPQAGAKSFGLVECIEHNGGAPEADPPVGPEASDPDEENELERAQRRAAEYAGGVEGCFFIYDAAQDVEFLLDCLENLNSTYTDVAPSAAICWLPVFRLRRTGAVGPTAVPVVPRRLAGGRPRGGSSSEPFDYFDVYLGLTRLRDRVFAGTAGGRRATQLYYASMSALLAAATDNPAVLGAGRDALEAWAPIVRALTTGDGTTPAVSATQIATFQAFLAAVRTGASPELRLSLEREALLVEPATFEGMTPAQLVERLDRLSCESTPAPASLRCRLGDLSRIVDTALDRKLRKAFASSLRKATKQAARAEAATTGTKRYRKALRRTERLVARIARRLGKTKVAARLPEDVRLVLEADVATLQADARALGSPPS